MKIFVTALQIFLLVLAPQAKAAEQMLNIPVWNLEKEGKRSYIIATLPVPVAAERIPNYVSNIIGSRIFFLSPYHEDDRAQMQLKITRIIQQRIRQRQSIRGQLGMFSPEWRYLKDIVRRAQISMTPGSAIIFKPLAALPAEMVPWILNWFPPGLVASYVIGAVSGKMSFEQNHPTMPETFLRLAKSQGRQIITLDSPSTLDVTDLIEIDQLKDLLNDLRSQRGKPFDFSTSTAWKSLFKSVDPIKAAEMQRQLSSEQTKWIEEIAHFHALGGSTIALGIEQLIDVGLGPSLLQRLSDAGFEISPATITQNATSCELLLTGSEPN